MEAEKGKIDEGESMSHEGHEISGERIPRAAMKDYANPSWADKLNIPKNEYCQRQALLSDCR
jgi:hypothetical protein